MSQNIVAVAVIIALVVLLGLALGCWLDMPMLSGAWCLSVGVAIGTLLGSLF